MQAIIRSQSSTQKVEIKEVPAPTPQPNQALISVKASSVNRGELSLLNMRADGWRPGQDFAGIVAKAAADGSGPTIGTRVAGLAEGGAWSELLAVETAKLVAVPDSVSFEDAAALPLAGLTALRTIRLGGDILGRAVLITAGSGGVGSYQLQLAILAGARVSAIIRNERIRTATQHELPETTLVSSLEALDERFDVVLDSVGGDALHKAIGALAPDGALVLFGNSSGELTPLSLLDFMPGHENAKILTYFSYHNPSPIANDLVFLFDLVASKKLRVFESETVNLFDLAHGLKDLADGKLVGKLIIKI